MDDAANRLFLEGEEDEGAVWVLVFCGDTGVIRVGKKLEPEEDVFRTEAGYFADERRGAFNCQCELMPMFFCFFDVGLPVGLGGCAIVESMGGVGGVLEGGAGLRVEGGDIVAVEGVVGSSWCWRSLFTFFWGGFCSLSFWERARVRGYCLNSVLRGTSSAGHHRGYPLRREKPSPQPSPKRRGGRRRGSSPWLPALGFYDF